MKSKDAITSDNFYNEISSFYGKMIDFKKNLELRIEAYKNIFPNEVEIADIGCGIGLDTIALGLNGKKVTSFDPSAKMIDELKNNANLYGVSIRSGVYGFNQIPGAYAKNFEGIVSVGNTIAHLNEMELKNAFKKINSLLKPKGKVFLHILNYNLIQKNNRRINNIANREGETIIRFYDFEKGFLRFNILSFPTNNPKAHKLVTTIHYPHSKSLIVNLLKGAGFIKIKAYGGFNKEGFASNESKDIFVEAYKGN